MLSIPVRLHDGMPTSVGAKALKCSVHAYILTNSKYCTLSHATLTSNIIILVECSPSLLLGSDLAFDCRY